MKRNNSLVGLVGVAVLAFCGTLAAQESSISLHPSAEKFPAPDPGPFVATADGAILTIAGSDARRSEDGGATWATFPALDPEKYSALDFSIVRAADDSIVVAFDNKVELKSGEWAKGSPSDWEIPVYSIRSVDGGKTWSAPVAIQRDWVGALRAMVVKESEPNKGRIVLAAMAVRPWEHFITTYYSDDAGQSWTKSESIVMEGSKINDHDGAMEPKLLEKKDGSLFMLIRTTRGTFFKSISTDGGASWSKPETTGIENNNSFGELAKLADGRWILLWNRDEKFPAFDYAADPSDWVVEDLSYSWIRRRNKLSLAISSDEGATWTEPIVVAETPDEKVWIAYSIFFEPEPGVFWIATQQGGVRMLLKEANLTK